MAKQSITQLKSWFVTAAKPLQSQFWDWLDSFRHKDDKIGAADLTDEVKSVISQSVTSQQLADALANFSTVSTWEELEDKPVGTDGRLLDSVMPFKVQVSDGTVSQIATETTVFVVDPAAVLASFGAVLPENGNEGQMVTIIFGGQITNGNKVITNYTGTTAAIGVSFDPIDAAGTEIYSGETMTYKVIKKIWKRIN